MPMLPILSWILSFHKEWYVSILVFIEVSFVLPSTVIALFTGFFNTVTDSALYFTHKNHPKWNTKNPLYHLSILMNMIVVAIYLPFCIIMSFIDGK